MTASRQRAGEVWRPPPRSYDGQGITVGGSHEHVFCNPQNLVFRVGCFGVAPGCTYSGAWTGRWSWFPGYR